jgi:hypothetical protein
MSGPKLLKYMDETYSLNEERLEYFIQNFSSALLNANEDLYEKLFIGYFDTHIVDLIHFKYYQIPKISKLHIKKNDSYSMINSIIYMDGMQDLYDLISESIDISYDEFVFCYSISLQSGSMSDYIKKVKERYQIEKSN